MNELCTNPSIKTDEVFNPDPFIGSKIDEIDVSQCSLSIDEV